MAADYCEHCECRGNYEVCMKTTCSYHTTWINQQHVKRIEDLEEVLADILKREK